MRSTLLAVALFCGTVATCWGDTVDVGYLYLQQDDSLGTVTFSINNATGPSEFAPDFPVLDNLDFNNVVVTLFCGNAQCTADLGGASQTYNIGTIASGGTDSSLSFSSADLFSSAVLSADLSLTSLNLDDGMGGSTPFTGSLSTSFTFSSASGPDLVPYDLSSGNSDFDSGVITDPEGTTSSVPEPASLTLIVTGFGSIVTFGKKYGNFRKTVRRLF